MTSKRFDLEFITPAYLTGANQNHAELRSPSIRGELRWWFRALGGTSEQECVVFGGVHGEPTASKVVVRVVDVRAKHADLPRIVAMSDFGYIHYFASVSGKRDGINRIQRDAFFFPGTRYTVDVVLRGTKLASADEDLLWRTVEAAWRLGALGLRSTRGCGSTTPTDWAPTRASLAEWVRGLPASVLVRACGAETQQDWKSCQEVQGAFLRNLRIEHRLSGKSQSALGFSDGRQRESSALRLRPVRLADGTFLPAVVYTDAACAQRSIKDVVLMSTTSL